MSPSESGSARQKKLDAIIQARLKMGYLEKPHPQNLESTPLSPAQEGIWLITQIFPESLAYNSPVHMTLRGEMEHAALAAALRRLLDRHSILRIRIDTVNGVPIQRVHPLETFPLPYTDLSDYPPAEQQVRLHELATRLTQERFQLAKGPLFRMRLVKITDREHVLLCVIHHIVFDGWSLSILKSEISQLFQKERTGPDVSLKELPLNYFDYAAWRREQSTRGTYQRQVDYWKSQLEGIPAEMRLPQNIESLAEPDGRGRVSVWHFSKAEYSSMRSFCLENKCTLFMLLAAGCMIWLFHYGNREEGVFGTPVAGRNLLDLEPLVGFFVNMLPLRIRMGERVTVREVLNDVNRTVLSALSHQDVSFHEIVQAVQPVRAVGRPPIFQMMMQYRNFPPMQTGSVDLMVERFHSELDPAPIDLSFAWDQAGDDLVCRLIYAESLFDPEMGEQIGRHYSAILSDLMDNVERPIAELSPLHRLDIDQLDAWNQTERRYLSHSARDLIRAQAQARPDQTAVEGDGARLTFRELDQRSTRWAAWLLEKGVGSGDRVVLALPRSIEAIIAMVAVMKAGAAYVPLDPDNPEERNLRILNDIAPRCILYQEDASYQPRGRPESAAGLFAAAVANRGDAYDIGVLTALTEIGTPELPAIGLEGLAYVIFTSGTTGQPKGVPITHAALSNYVQGYARRTDLMPTDRQLQFASMAFDFSVEDIFVTLCAGATLVLRTEAMLDPDICLEEIAARKVTRVSLPTAFFHLVTTRLKNHPLADCVRCVLIGGEALQQTHVDHWFRATGGRVRLINTYGPTETCITATAVDITPDQRGVPIGTPLPNYRVYVLDPQGYRAPVGVEGELFIAGVGVSPGYWQAEDQTQISFVTAANLPGVPDHEGIVYRTGDHVKWDLGGNLHFIGRRDRQVKLRGNRVELDAIEHVLTQHPEVADCLVMVRSEQLVVYFRTHAGTTPADLPAFLARRLPAFMVPGRWVALADWPLTPTGKIDIEALPSRPVEVMKADEKPQTEAEMLVGDIWKRVLDLDLVNRSDNFFDLGGDSIRAVKIIHRIEEATGKFVPILKLFDHPILSEFAAEI